jgi:hypothetical protein
MAVIGVKSAMSNEAVLFCTRSMVCDSDSTTRSCGRQAPHAWVGHAGAPDAPAWFSTTTGW